MIDLSLFRINLSHNILYAKKNRKKKEIKKACKTIKEKAKATATTKTDKNAERLSRPGRGMDETEE